MSGNEYDYKQIHIEGQEGEPGRIVVKGYGDYPKHSVNYGMTRVVFLGAYDSEEEARSAHPELGAEDNYGSKFIDDDLKRIPSEPPSWFDPAAAGERWDDDY